MGLKHPLLFFTIITLNVINAGDDERKVVFLNVLHRHGARTPHGPYPADPYKDAFATLWPEGKGQLTNLGKKQTFQLGQWLRQRYDALLTERYSPDIIYVQSTDKDRTLMSVECVLAGMYPPKGVQEWSETLAWQPIPVHTTPLNKNKVLSLPPPYIPCPAYDEELQRVFTTNEQIREWNKTYSDLFRWVNEHAGAVYTLRTVMRFYDVLLVENFYNLTLPEWTKKVFPEPLKAASTICFRLQTWNSTKLIRLRTGLLLKDMIKHMEDKVHNKTTRSVHVYSAHDDNLINFMVALGAYNNILPTYAACLMLELQKDPGNAYYVSLFYRNSTSNSSEEPHLLTVQGCAPPCPLDKFIAVAKPFIPDDWDLECELHIQSSFPIVTILVFIVILVIVPVVGAVAFLMWNNYVRSHRHPSSQTQETSQNAINPAPVAESA